MQRRTKIVATLGPSSSSQEVLESLIKTGVDVVRMNFSHGTAAEHAGRAELVRHIARNHAYTVGVLADLQGPKIRIGKFADGRITLARAMPFILDANCTLGTAERVGLDYKELPQDVDHGDTLLLDDGRIELQVERVYGAEIICRVVHGGVLSSNKGINRKGGGLSAPSLTAKDLDDIKTAARFKADFLAISFPRNGDDVTRGRELMREAGGRALVIAKIERTEAVAALGEIIEAADGIMVARGDLAVEMGDAVVPALQKRMLKQARARHKVAITATQMMESMVDNPIPTRAEVSDVANAVLDGTDAVMLSAETASGRFPVQTVAAMARVCIEAEKEADIVVERRFTHEVFTRIDQSIATTALFTANHLKAKAIGALTQSGSTPLWMSRNNAAVPIYALTPVTETRRRVTLFRGVFPIRFTNPSHNREEVLRAAEEELLRRGAVAPGDIVILTIGDTVGKTGHTNTLTVVRVGEHVGQ